jgi:hypothetical protein
MILAERDNSFRSTSIVPGETSPTDSASMVFTRRIYVYYEYFMSLSQLATLELLYGQNNLSVEFRGHDWLNASLERESTGIATESSDGTENYLLATVGLL